MGNNIINKRIDELDYIRGFALLGIILVNILALLNIKIRILAQWMLAIKDFILICRRSFLLNLLILIWSGILYLYFKSDCEREKWLCFILRLVALFILV